MLEGRRQLPVYSFREEIIDAVRGAHVVIVSGETGSGKTTQVPQFLLEDMLWRGEGGECNIIVTQPRRITAIGVAERVANEMGQVCGKKGALCGYQIRMESKRTAQTRLMYMTTGVLLRKLQGDPALSSVSHVIIDEVHERSIHSDFLMVLLKRILQLRRDAGVNGQSRRGLKLVLMSATMDKTAMQRFFTEDHFACPVLSIPGRTFPVTHYFLEQVVDMIGYAGSEGETIKTGDIHSTSVRVTGRGGNTHTVSAEWRNDSDIVKDVIVDSERINFELIEALLLYIHAQREGSLKELKDGAILVFMPGLAAINTLNDCLLSSSVFGDHNKYQIFALHSSLPSVGGGKRSVFARPPPGVRKIVIATNIAETGITIPDAVIVIDTGRMKQVVCTFTPVPPGTSPSILFFSIALFLNRCLFSLPRSAQFVFIFVQFLGIRYHRATTHVRRSVV